MLWSMTERESCTFDFGEDRLEHTTIEDVQSTADHLLIARGGAVEVDMRRIDHRPRETVREDRSASKRRQAVKILTAAIGILAGVAGIASFVTSLF